MAKLGMFLIRVVVWATAQTARAEGGQAGYLRAAAGYSALACVSLIGRSIDGLASIHQMSTGQRRHVGSTPHAIRG